MSKYIKKCREKEVKKITDYVAYSRGGVISRALVQSENFSFIFFSLAKNEGISPYSMDANALVHVFDGSIEIRIEGKPDADLLSGELMAIEANVLFGIEPVTPAKIIMYTFRD